MSRGFKCSVNNLESRSVMSSADFGPAVLNEIRQEVANRAIFFPFLVDQSGHVDS